MPDVNIKAGSRGGGSPVAESGNMLGPLLEGGKMVAQSAFNAWQADRQMDFQRDMANTSHFREVRDLRRSGLNPILSARYGGAASPPGSAATAANADIAGSINQSSALQVQKELAKNQINLMSAQGADAYSAADLKDAQTKAMNEKLPIEKLKLQQELKNLGYSGTSSAYGLEEQRLKNRLWQIPNYGADKVKQGGKWLLDFPSRSQKYYESELDKVLPKGWR